MPTGYTAKLCEEEMSFNEFATSCMRAFGSCIHMRDEPIGKEYEPRPVSEYHKTGLKDALKEMEELNNTSDSDLRTIALADDTETKTYHIKKINEINLMSNRLNSMLRKVKDWTPPTSEHDNFQKFMIEQLESTIKHDANTKYHHEGIDEIKSKVYNADDIRTERAKKIQWNIDYHTKEHAKDVESAAESNKWVKQLIESI